MVKEGDRRVSYRKRVLQYCEKESIKIHHKFEDQETLKIVLIDISIPQRPLLLWRSFNRTESAFEYLFEENKHPLNYRVMNFKSGKEYKLDIGKKSSVKSKFDQQISTDYVF